MKNHILKTCALISLLVCSSLIHTNAQTSFFDPLEHGNDIDSSLRSSSSSTAVSLSYNGAVHTPKGNLHILVIFAGFTASTNPYPDTYGQADGIWEPDDIPQWAMGASNYLFDNDAAITKAGTGNRNLSKYYYTMSNKQFVITADVFPEMVLVEFDNPIILANQNIYNQRVFDAINKNASYANFNWSKYDNRDNYPNYQSDNSTSSPDGEIDYVYIIYRNFTGGFTGLSGILGAPFTVANSTGTFKITNGHIASECYNSPIHHLPYFTHEFAHNLYSSPHYMGANTVVGNKLYQHKGWGMMANTHAPFFTANAWERWWLGWITPQEITINGQYTVKDFITDNDAIRILIPGTSNQYLWIENHQLMNTDFDQKLFYLNRSQITPGLYCYISKNGESQTNPLNSSSKTLANMFTILNAEGNFDYLPVGNATVPGGSSTINFNENGVAQQVPMPYFIKTENLFSMQNDLTAITYDYNNSGKIAYNDNANASAENEITFVWTKQKDGINLATYANTGDTNDAFVVGSEIGLSGIVPAVSNPFYNNSNHDLGLDPHIINGLSVKMLSKNSAGDYTIEVKFDDYEVRTNKRWSGDLILPDFDPPGNLSGIADYLNIMPSVTLTIDKSGTPNRTTLTAEGDFINPTVLTCLDGSHFHLEPASKVFINGGSMVRIKKGSILEIHENANFIVGSGTLILEQGSSGVHTSRWKINNRI